MLRLCGQVVFGCHSGGLGHPCRTCRFRLAHFNIENVNQSHVEFVARHSGRDLFHVPDSGRQCRNMKLINLPNRKRDFSERFSVELFGTATKCPRCCNLSTFCRVTKSRASDMSRKLAHIRTDRERFLCDPEWRKNLSDFHSCPGAGKGATASISTQLGRLSGSPETNHVV